MTASHFRTLVKNFTALTPEELDGLKSLSGKHAYSQLIQLMIARGTRDHATADQQIQLHRAAIYSTDRSVVKWAMTLPAQTRVEIELGPESVTAAQANAAPVVVNEPPAKKKATLAQAAALPKPAQPSPAETLEGDALREDLSKELQRLQQLKHNFEAAYETLHASASTSKSVPMAPPVIKTSPSKESVTGADPHMHEAPLIEEIKATRKKLKVPSPKVAEQGEIIDNFIKVAPSLPKAKLSEPSTDLSEASVNYSDHIISETLVEILLKQGKKAKAMEMLKKLIWKFPQKKAYFAAQIEALKN